MLWHFNLQVEVQIGAQMKRTRTSKLKMEMQIKMKWQIATLNRKSRLLNLNTSLSPVVLDGDHEPVGQIKRPLLGVERKVLQGHNSIGKLYLEF